jgi:hypothetical protein
MKQSQSDKYSAEKEEKAPIFKEQSGILLGGADFQR